MKIPKAAQFNFGKNPEVLKQDETVIVATGRIVAVAHSAEIPDGYRIIDGICARKTPVPVKKWA